MPPYRKEISESWSLLAYLIMALVFGAIGWRWSQRGLPWISGGTTALLVFGFSMMMGEMFEVRSHLIVCGGFVLLGVLWQVIL
ncbi:MAG: hypothetical protein WBE58_22195 [Verrucomicrobiales bacterium]|nr:hypothetical protein [Verrucomicrobiales bacterium]